MGFRAVSVWGGGWVVDAGVSRARLLSLAQPGSVRGKPGARALTPLGGLGLLSSSVCPLFCHFLGCAGEQQVLWKSTEPSAPGRRVDSAEPGHLEASSSFRCPGRSCAQVREGRRGVRPVTGLFLGRGACGCEQEVLLELGLAGHPRLTLSGWRGCPGEWRSAFPRAQVCGPPLLTGRDWG